MFGLFESPVVIPTSLTKPQVIDRLTKSFDRARYLSELFGSFVTVARINEKSCWFETNGWSRRRFRRLTLFYRDRPNGISLEGKFDISLAQQLPIIAVFAVGLMVAVRFLYGGLIAFSQGEFQKGFSGFVPLGFLSLAYAMIRINLWWARSGEEELLREVEYVLTASPAVAIDPTTGLPVEGEIFMRPRHERFN